MRKFKPKSVLYLVALLWVPLATLLTHKLWPWPVIKADLWELSDANMQTSVPKDLQPTALQALSANLMQYRNARTLEVQWYSYSHFYDFAAHTVKYIYDRNKSILVYDDAVSRDNGANLQVELEVYEGVSDAAIHSVARAQGTHQQLTRYGGKINVHLSQGHINCCA